MKGEIDMCTIDKYDTYFTDGDAFVYVPASSVKNLYRIKKVARNSVDMEVTMSINGNMRPGIFIKQSVDVPDIYKVLKEFQ